MGRTLSPLQASYKPMHVSLTPDVITRVFMLFFSRAAAPGDLDLC
jgi:hypothetical protein